MADPDWDRGVQQVDVFALDRGREGARFIQAQNMPAVIDEQIEVLEETRPKDAPDATSPPL